MNGERVEIVVLREWQARRVDELAVALGLSPDEVIAEIVDTAIHHLEAYALGATLPECEAAGWPELCRAWWRQRIRGAVA